MELRITRRDGSKHTVLYDEEDAETVEQYRKWRAKIQINKAPRHLGQFETEEAAAHAYDDAAREAWGEFALLNFEDQGVRS